VISTKWSCFNGTSCTLDITHKSESTLNAQRHLFLSSGAFCISSSARRSSVVFITFTCKITDNSFVTLSVSPTMQNIIKRKILLLFASSQNFHSTIFQDISRVFQDLQNFPDLEVLSVMVVQQQIWGEVVVLIPTYPADLFWKNMKLVHVCQSYHKNKSGTLFWDTVYMHTATVCLLETIIMMTTELVLITVMTDFHRPTKFNVTFDNLWQKMAKSTTSILKLYLAHTEQEQTKYKYMPICSRRI